MPELHRRPSETTSSYDWGDLSISYRNQHYRLGVLSEQILLKEAEAQKRGLDLPLHQERGLSLDSEEKTIEASQTALDRGEVLIARLSGYLDILNQALGNVREEPSSDAQKNGLSKEQAEYWRYELLFRAEQLFPEALQEIKLGMIVDTVPFPLEDMVKKIHGDQKLLPAERRHLDEVILAVRLRWDRLVRGHLKLSGEKHFRKREIAQHVLEDTELWKIIFSQKFLASILEKVPAEVWAAAAAEAFVTADMSHEQVRTTMLNALPSYGYRLLKNEEISPALFDRLVTYFEEKKKAIARAYEMISRLTHPEAWQRVVCGPQLIEKLRDKFTLSEPPDTGQTRYRA